MFVWRVNSPARGDFPTGEEEDSKVGSAAASSLKVTVCCFGGVATNPTTTSVDTNHSLYVPNNCQIILCTPALLVSVACRLKLHVTHITTTKSPHKSKQRSQSSCLQVILITFSLVISDRVGGGHHGRSDIYNVEFNFLVQTKGVTGLSQCRTSCDRSWGDTCTSCRKKEEQV